MNSPVVINCHGDTSGGGVFKLGSPVWREPQLQRAPYGESFRSCSYCGSIHPEDLIKLLEAGATMHGADWKYGWPHKFYVENIPNPHGGKTVKMGSRIGPDVTGTTPGSEWNSTCGHADCQLRTREHGYWELPFMEPAPKMMRAKFYNAHLKDCPDELFAKLAPLLKRHTGIEWTRDPERGVGYRAPTPGYQRT